MMSTTDAFSNGLSNEFIIPTNKEIGATRVAPDLENKACTYLSGNSLGPLSRRSEKLVKEELGAWGTRAVEAHFSHPFGREWMYIADQVTPYLAELVGARPQEVACMGSLTSNLHLMMSTFYKPTPGRYKIMCEAKAFPSDQYAFAAQASFHGLDPKTAILEICPRDGEHTLREEDILDAIAKEGSSIALVLFSGVQYYTGQWFPMQSITRKAKEQGCVCGWDLAHAIGNVPLALHDWDVDFAVWCSYKYLNSGPGGIAGLFIHEKWNETEPPKFTGWWGHDPSTRFAMMSPHFSAIPGAQGFQQSNPSVLNTASLLGALQIFKEAGMMPALRARSLMLTGTLEALLMQSRFFVPVEAVAALYPPITEGEKDPGTPGFMIITPRDPESRGAQLSLMFLPAGTGVMERMYATLNSCGVIGDKRSPDVLRLAPTPLYNSLGDCHRAVVQIEQAFDLIVAQ